MSPYATFAYFRSRSKVGAARPERKLEIRRIEIQIRWGQSFTRFPNYNNVMENWACAQAKDSTK